MTELKSFDFSSIFVLSVSRSGFVRLMIVAVVAAIMCTADHVSRQCAEACTNGNSAKIPANQAARDTTSHSTYDGASAGCRPVVA